MLHMNHLASRKQQIETSLASLLEPSRLCLLGFACLDGFLRSLSSKYLFCKGQERPREVLRFLALKYDMSRLGVQDYTQGILRCMTW